MDKPKFNTNGIYIRRINRELEIEGYKPGLLERFAKTKVHNRWNEANPIYEMVCFMSVKRDNGREYYGGYEYNISFDLEYMADSMKSSALTRGRFNNIVFRENGFEMSDEELSLSGKYDENRGLEICVKNKVTGNRSIKYYRFIQWL